MERKIKVILVHNYFQPFKDPMSILSVAIQKAADCYYNHCEVLIEEPDGEKYVIGAVYPRVRKIKFGKWLGQLERDFKLVDLPSHKTDQEMIDFANSMVGKRYDVTSLVFFLPWYLVIKAWFNRKLWIGRKQGKADRRPYCYELAALVAGFPDCYNITPNELISKLEQINQAA